MKPCECGCGGSAIRRFVHGHNSKTRSVKPDGYRAVYPKGRGRVMAHVLIAEAALGKRLPSGAVVHHVNGNTHDNSNANLVICQDRAYHSLLHYRARIVQRKGSPDHHKICSVCDRVLGLHLFWKDSRHQGSGRNARCKDCWAFMKSGEPEGLAWLTIS